MKIACEACGAKYTIADDKVRGRKVKIRCKGCGTPIVVDGQQGGGASVPAADADTDALLEADAPAVWSVNLSDTDSRTMSVEEIVAGYASGLVSADAFVWKDGMADWVAILESELAPLLPVPPAAAPVAAAPAVATTRGGVPAFTTPGLGGPRPVGARPAATRAQAQPDNTQDLFGAIDAAGSGVDEVATSAPTVPQAGTSAYDDGKLTGARNENSVLFSLDALKAGFSPSAPSAKPAPKAPASKGTNTRPQQPSNPDDPFGMGVSQGLGGLSGGVLFGDNHALLTAPAPPPPPPPAQVTAGAHPTYAAPSQLNKLAVIGGGVASVAIIGLLIALLFGKKHEAAPSADSSALGGSSAAPSASSAAEAKKEESAPKVEDNAAASASAVASTSASATASASASAAPAIKPGAGAVAVVKKPKEDAPPPADAPPFSKAAAISALSAAAVSAGSCKKPGGPTGGGKATITFAPSGRVTTATVSGGSFAGTPVGGCIASVFRRSHVPAFSGSSVTVSKSFSIN